MTRQFVVEIPNRPGALSHLAHVLAMRSVNIHHLAAIGAGEAGHVVLVVDNERLGREALRDAGYSFSEGEQVLARVEDRPGALAKATDALAEAGVDVSSAVEVGRHGKAVDLAFTVDDVERAHEALRGLSFSPPPSRG